jgi:hypothetical protein
MQGVYWRIAGVLLGAAWAGFWVFFGVASGLDEHLTPLGVLVHTTVPGLIFVASLIAALVWPKAGTIVLAIEGFIVIAGYPWMVHNTRHFNLTTVGFIWLTMGVPPIAAAWLLRVAGR